MRVSLLFLVACCLVLLYCVALEFAWFDWHGNIVGWAFVAALCYVAAKLPWER